MPRNRNFTLDQITPILPHFQAILNSASALALALAYLAIRRGDRGTHRLLMIAALAVSGVFLVSYLYYHAQVGYAPFEGQGWIRPLYFTLLASHIVLAAAIVPLVLATVYLAARGNFTRHPRVARWALPAWLYVSVSGVAVYLLGFHLYRPT